MSNISSATSSIRRAFDRLLTWIWPFSEIMRLRSEISRLQSELDKASTNVRIERIEVTTDFTHWRTWLSNANQIWGPRLFDPYEVNFMRFRYEEGLTWRESVDQLRLASAQGRNQWHKPLY